MSTEARRGRQSPPEPRDGDCHGQRNRQHDHVAKRAGHSASRLMPRSARVCRKPTPARSVAAASAGRGGGERLVEFGSLAFLVAMTVALLSPSPASAAACVTAPHLLRPGSVVTVTVAGFPPGSRARLQLGVHFARPTNCCVSLVFPSIHRPGISIGKNGVARVRWRVPRVYARCTSSACVSPENTPFRHGQAVRVYAATGTAFAEAAARIA